MQDIRTLLRYYHEEQYSKREIARYLRVSAGTVRNYLRRAELSGLSWPLPSEFTDADLESLLFPDSGSDRPQPDWSAIEKELSRKGMRLDLVWQDWIAEHPDGYSYGYFCACYKRWSNAQKITTRLEHKAKEKLFVDFAGKTVEVIDPGSGEIINAQIFVATMGGSSSTYVEAVPDQSVRSWITAHVNCLNFLQARPRIIVCDNWKASVTCARGKPRKIQETYVDFARHYDLILDPARVRDKACVELAVKHITTHILTKRDGRQFFSIHDVNQAIGPLLDAVNDKPFQNKEGSRRREFERIDLCAMRALAEQSYEFWEWKKLNVNLNYHVQTHGGYYSVAHGYAHHTLDVHSQVVICSYRGKEVARHARLQRKRAYSTLDRHMPPKHKWDRERRLGAAREVGLNAALLCEAILELRTHQEQKFLSIKGILGLRERYGKERLEAACALALALGTRAYNYPSLSSILKTGRDELFEQIPAYCA